MTDEQKKATRELLEAAEHFLDAQCCVISVGNGVTDATGTMDEGAYLYAQAHRRLVDATLAARAAN